MCCFYKIGKRRCGYLEYSERRNVDVFINNYEKFLLTFVYLLSNHLVLSQLLLHNKRDIILSHDPACLCYSPRLNPWANQSLSKQTYADKDMICHFDSMPKEIERSQCDAQPILFICLSVNMVLNDNQKDSFHRRTGCLKGQLKKKKISSIHSLYFDALWTRHERI
jgi:hypothetical protein